VGHKKEATYFRLQLYQKSTDFNAVFTVRFRDLKNLKTSKVQFKFLKDFTFIV